MSAPTLTPWGQRMYDRLAPWAYADADNGYPIAWFCAAWAAMHQDVADATEPRADGTPGLAAMADPLICPAWNLPALAARAGVDLDPGLSEAAQRLAINAVSAADAGKPSAIIAAAQLESLDPDNPRTVILVEGNGTLTVRVYAAQTPADVVPLIRARLEQEVPFEVKWTLQVAEGWTWGDAVEHYGPGATFGDVAADNATIGDAASQLPD